MCSCGTSCVDAPAAQPWLPDQEEIIKSRTPDYETFKDGSGTFTGFVSASPLGTDDLMYAEEQGREATVWLEPGRAYHYSELTPEQQSIYDQGHRQGREDALNLAQAIANEVADSGRSQADKQADFDFLATAMNTNFEAVVGAHNDLCAAVAELDDNALDVVTKLGDVLEDHRETLRLNHLTLESILDRLEWLEDLVLPEKCGCGCGG